MEKLADLRNKIEATGQDFETYVNGWQRASFQNYWDYVQLDTLLSLQRPVTDIADGQSSLFTTKSQNSISSWSHRN